MNRTRWLTLGRLAGLVFAILAGMMAFSSSPAIAAGAASSGTDVNGYAFCKGWAPLADPCTSVTLSGNGYNSTATPSSSMMPGERGKFTFRSVPPGNYTLTAHTPDRNAGNPTEDQCSEPVKLVWDSGFFLLPQLGPWNLNAPCEGVT